MQPSFWIIPAGVDSNTMVRYNRSIRTTASRTLSCTLLEFTAIFSSGFNPVIYEVFDRPDQKLKLYFDIDIACDGVPTEAKCHKVLVEACSFLRDTIPRAQFATSEAHRSGKISFHIVCTNIFTTDRQVMKAIAKLGASKGLGFDPVVYMSRQLMRPACSMGEKTDSVPFKPSIGACFSDHVVQAVPPLATLLPTTFSVPAAPKPKYTSSGYNVLEDLIAAFDFNKIGRPLRITLMQFMKSASLRTLFDYLMVSMDDYLDGSNKRRLDAAWHGTVCRTTDTQDQILTVCKALYDVNREQANAVLKKYNLIFSGGVIKDAVPEEEESSEEEEPLTPKRSCDRKKVAAPVPVVRRTFPTAPVRKVATPDAFDELEKEVRAPKPALVVPRPLPAGLTQEDRSVMREVLTEKIAALTRIRDLL